MEYPTGRTARDPLPRGPELHRVGHAQRMQAQEATRLRFDGLDVDHHVTRSQELIDARLGLVRRRLLEGALANVRSPEHPLARRL